MATSKIVEGSVTGGRSGQMLFAAVAALLLPPLLKNDDMPNWDAAPFLATVVLPFGREGLKAAAEHSARSNVSVLIVTIILHTIVGMCEYSCSSTPQTRRR
uniref:Uncharacterized protein n=1 Tax=Craspedostauros australis TaxID=1486917 RepID=A0A6T6ECC2_9STRA